jgi:hypothetical protein
MENSIDALVPITIPPSWEIGTASDSPYKGPAAINTLGVWAKGSTIKLYINDRLAAEFTDDSGLKSGYFGLVSIPLQSAGHDRQTNEIAYYNLP